LPCKVATVRRKAIHGGHSIRPGNVLRPGSKQRLPEVLSSRFLRTMRIMGS
jgi:hypothetical protein